MPFPVSAFNLGASVEERLPDCGRDDALAILVGNSRHLWSIFRKAVARKAVADDQAWLGAAHPLDQYVTQTVTEAAGTTGVRHELRWGHAMHPRPIPIQRIAKQIGFAALSPSHLSVHAVLGPWIALRAVAVFDIPGPIFTARPSREPCESCARPCLPALEKALGSEGARSPDAIQLGTDWPQWLAVRDACPIGTAHRYSDDQIAYHYTKNRSLLTGG